MEEPTAATPEPDSERRFERLVEHVPGMVVYLDVVQPHDPGSSVPVYISPQVEELLGYQRAAWLGEGELWIEVLHPEDRERMVAADAHARASMRYSAKRGVSVARACASAATIRSRSSGCRTSIQSSPSLSHAACS